VKALQYVRAAFLAPANLIGLSAATVGSVVVHDPIPAAVALGLEALYLGTLSWLPQFRRAVRAERPSQRTAAAEVERMLAELAPSQREHYHVLRELRDKIEENYRKLPSGTMVVASSERSVDALLTAFLRLVLTLNHYRKFLNAADRHVVEGELVELRAELEGETHPRLREVKEKRLEILQKRLSRFEQAAESREIISHQLAGIEDLLRLTHEQSIAIRDPQSVSRQLDVLSAEVASSEETVREMERFLEFDEELAPSLPHGTRVR
jgi:hypothetical protein